MPNAKVGYFDSDRQESCQEVNLIEDKNSFLCVILSDFHQNSYLCDMNLSVHQNQAYGDKEKYESFAGDVE